MTTPEITVENSKSKMSLAKRFAIGGLVAISLIGVGGTIAMSQEMGGKGHGMFGRHDRGEFMEFRFNKMLSTIKATPEQTEKLKAVFEKVKTEMHPGGQEGKQGGQGGKHGGKHGGQRMMNEKVMELLAAPTIDKAAIEAVRAEQIATMDARSKVMTDAMIEAAEILTPEQRTTLAEEMKKHRRHD